MMEDFGTITLIVCTDLPAETDAELEERHAEFIDFRDSLEALFAQAVNLVPAGWKVSIQDD